LLELWWAGRTCQQCACRLRSLGLILPPSLLLSCNFSFSSLNYLLFGGYSLNHSLTHCSRFWLLFFTYSTLKSILTNFLSNFSKTFLHRPQNHLPNLHGVLRRRGISWDQAKRLVMRVVVTMETLLAFLCLDSLEYSILRDFCP
jgi:hypothetical protein